MALKCRVSKIRFFPLSNSQIRNKIVNQKIKTSIVIGMVAIFAVAAGVFVWNFWNMMKAGKIGTVKEVVPDENSKIEEKKACTQEAKQCPDGSYVSRTGQNCEFAACPEEDFINSRNWKIYKNKEYGFEMSYPGNLLAEDSNPKFDYSKGINFRGEGKSFLRIFIKIYDKVLYGLDEVEKTNDDYPGERLETNKVDVNGIPTVKIKFSGTSQSGSFDEVYFIKNNAAFAFYFSTVGSARDISEEENKIISSLKFAK